MAGLPSSQSANKAKFQQSQVSLGLVEEKIRRCLLSAVTNINLSETLPPNPDDWRMDEPHMMDAFHDRVYHDQVLLLGISC